MERIQVLKVKNVEILFILLVILRELLEKWFNYRFLARSFD